VTRIPAGASEAPLKGDSRRLLCDISPSTSRWVEGATAEPTTEFAQLQLGFVDQTQWCEDIPHVPKRGVNQAPGSHQYKALHRHQYWFIDGRRLVFALDGVWWWSLIILEGYSHTILAGAMAPTEATWAALMVLYTACLRYGAPGALVSDSGRAYTSAAMALSAVFAR
jgi:hypothetical protein